MAKRKNPAAVALGRRGGKKGGPALAAKLTPEERSASARRAARARWRVVVVESRGGNKWTEDEFRKISRDEIRNRPPGQSMGSAINGLIDVLQVTEESKQEAWRLATDEATKIDRGQ